MKELLAFSEELIKSEMLDLDDAYKMQKYEGLSAEGLRLALADEASRVACEHTVFFMVYKWLKGGEGRERAFPDLSKLIRYPNMTSSFLNLIQQLPETQPAEVAYVIKRALVIRGLREEHYCCLAQDESTERKLKLEGALPPRPGAKAPFTETVEVTLDKARICALKDNGTICVDKREVFGYMCEGILTRMAEGFGLLTKLSTSFSLSGPEPDVSSTNGFELDNATPLFIKLRIEHQGQGFTCVSNLPVTTQQFGVGRDWYYLTVLKLRFGGEEGKELLAENFVEQKLKLRVSITFP